LFTDFAGVTHQQTIDKTQSNQTVSPTTEKGRAQMQRAARMSGTVRRMSNLLTKKKVPFEPTILFARNWKSRVRPYLESMPEMSKTETLPQKFGGAKIANIVYLPDKIELTGDTIILANYLVFARKQVEIVGYDDLLVFPMKTVLSDNVNGRVGKNGSSVSFIKTRYGSEKELLRAQKDKRLVAPESVRITLDGWGRDQFLERERQRKAGLVAHHAAFQTNIDKPAGATGQTGERGEPGQTPGQTSAGANGSCFGNPSGVVGNTGQQASSAGTGQEGYRGVDGDDAGTLISTIDPAVSSYSFSARGGRGGQGGQGGPGGFSAIGGQGGDGGLAALCPCDRFSGNGGPGGPGGQGGTGGWGGKGGPGANGGRGGTLNLTIPCNYTGSYETNVTRGGLGPGGEPGVYTNGGAGGPGGAGKPGASNPNCPSLGGLAGAGGGSGPPGEPGEGGTRGDNGQPGASDGSVNPTFTGNCGNPPGGGGDPSLEPGSPMQYCTPWYWVWYHCEFYLDRLNANDERNIHANHVSSSAALTAFGWECFETNREYAGCW
jgi:hypothetical protein